MDKMAWCNADDRGKEKKWEKLSSISLKVIYYKKQKKKKVELRQNSLVAMFKHRKEECISHKTGQQQSNKSTAEKKKKEWELVRF